VEQNQVQRLGLKSVGKDVVIWPMAKVVAPGAVTIGDSVMIDDFVFIMGGESTTIGSFVHIASFVSLVGGGTLVLEDFAGLSGGVRVYTGNDDFLGGSLTGPTVPPQFRRPTRGKVHIGRHVVVGANSVVLPGVTIGEGAVVGANSLVKSNIEPWTVNVGSPSRAVRERPRDTILRLEAELRACLYDAEGHYRGVSSPGR
jgi:acetyltransferase-like isoleucine patch superfamily enzyme